MTAMLIYKTTSPAAQQVLNDLDAEREVAFDSVDHFCRQVAREIGPGKDGETRCLVGYGRCGDAVGVEKVDGEDTPKGWLDRGRYLAPDRRYKSGKEHDQTLRSLRLPSSDDTLQRLGMPSATLVGDRYYQPGMKVDGGTVYVTWGSRDVEEKVDEERAKHYSGTGVEWTTIPRSEWYALVEEKGWEK